ncbi:BLUF domain-containing protein [Methyloversatilis thermotolerans]|uniref:BLUF domain-containing protein n=1 Tax=Methyloversatilis thermotolerans TaxID=1346290 RepID=UPI00039A5E62|nr:BLUF domain-containing protein [Methyloversatilis thermotolerans]
MIPYQLIYTSTLAPHISPSCVVDIMLASRQKNPERGLTGLLLFDGRHFCQYLEGTRTNVVVMCGLIETDPRHSNFTVLHEGPLLGERLFADWSMAYAPTDGSVFSSFAGLTGPAAVDHLKSLQAALEIEA